MSNLTTLLTVVCIVLAIALFVAIVIGREKSAKREIAFAIDELQKGLEIMRDMAKKSRILHENDLPRNLLPADRTVLTAILRSQRDVEEIGTDYFNYLKNAVADREDEIRNLYRADKILSRDEL